MSDILSWHDDEYTGDHVLDLGMLFLRVAVAPRMISGEGLKNIVLTQAGDWVIFSRSGHVYGHGTSVEDAKHTALDAAKMLTNELMSKLT
jgi:hypothetical protein